MMQSLYVSAVAVPVGMALGLGAVYGWMELAHRFAEDAQTMGIHILPGMLVFTALLSVGTVLFASLIPARSAARISPVEAMRGGFHVKAEKLKKRRQWLPVFGVTGMLARKNIMRMPGRLRVTVLSLTLAMVLLMLTVAVGCLSVTTLLIPNERDILLYAQEGADALSDEFIERVRAIPGVIQITGHYSRNVVVDMRKDAYTQQFWQNIEDLSRSGWGAPATALIGADRKTVRMTARIETYDQIDMNAARRYVLQGAFDEETMIRERSVGVLAYATMQTKTDTERVRVEGGEFRDSPVYNRRMTRINTLVPGDTLTLYDMDNSREYLNMSGYTPIGGNIKPVGQVSVGAVTDGDLMYGKQADAMDQSAYLYMSPVLFRELFPNVRPYQLSLKTDPELHKTAVQALANMQLSDASFSMTDMEQSNRDMFAYLLVYLGAIGLFMLVLVMISFTSILNTMAAGVLSRKREFAMMIACGMSGEQLTQVVRKEGKLYAVYAAMAGGFLTAVGFVVLVVISGADYIVSELGLPSLIAAPLLAALALWLMTRAATRMPLKKLKEMDLVQAMSTDE